jgi:hypothetical protein
VERHLWVRSGLIGVVSACVRCAAKGLACVAQTGGKSRACQACATAKAGCSLKDGEDDVRTPEPVAPKSRARVDPDAQTRLAVAAEQSALHHKRSAEALERSAAAQERSAKAQEAMARQIASVDASMRELLRRVPATTVGGGGTAPRMYVAPEAVTAPLARRSSKRPRAFSPEFVDSEKETGEAEEEAEEGGVNFDDVMDA